MAQIAGRAQSRITFILRENSSSVSFSHTLRACLHYLPDRWAGIDPAGVDLSRLV